MMTLMVLYSRVMVRQSVAAKWHLFLLLIKTTGGGELDLTGFVSEVVDSGFNGRSGSSGVFKARSVSAEDQALLFLASLIVSGQPETKGAFY